MNSSQSIIHAGPLYASPGSATALTFDRWTENRLRRLKSVPDALIAISGSSLNAGRWLQSQGGVFLCDRGSTHQRYQQELVEDEYARWGVDRPVSDIRDTEREEAIYQQADAITVPSTYVAQSFLEMGVPAAKLHTIPFGVRLGDYGPPGEPMAGEFNVLFAGGAGLRKGIPYLLEAFANLQHPKKTLRIAGYVRDNLRDVLHRLPKDQVEFLGPVSRSQMADLMGKSDVLVLPSIEDGFGLVMAEAMNRGCPVIASTNTGAGDLYTDGLEGFIVPIRDAAAILEKMQWMVDNPLLAQQMRVAAVAKVKKLGGWGVYGDRWEALLKDLTGKS